MPERPNPVPSPETEEKDSEDQKREELCAQIRELLNGLLDRGIIFEELNVPAQKES